MDDKDKKTYELAFLLEKEEDFPEVLRLCRQHNLEVKSENQPKKISLAYKIDKLTQACFSFLRMLGSPDDIKSLEKDLKTTPQVKRSMIIWLPKEALATREPVTTAPERQRRPMPKRRPPAATLPQKPAAETLSNEELERRIEEILQ